MKKKYRPDFFCYDAIIVELKALGELTGEHEAQVLNYLKASQKKLGLLINFGSKSRTGKENSPKVAWSIFK